ncbi:MAG: hypothetical protein ACOYCD_06555 [Kiritimatiellia bacterium]|jgi:hypothetical protein
MSNTPTENTAYDLQRKSSAITLSDMEVFVFPELIYSLLLANLMSPRIWPWRDDPWFKNLARLKPGRRLQRLKQFIMDHYVFNLDLNTWGLTTKAREMARFGDFIDTDALRQSNALFGYEGDKYYFDIDIRTHFGLDKYDGDVIPYWKTETVEAMDAFRYRPGYQTGAGECVSLAVLYAAAIFIVCRVPLENIFLMATPLHSQNFVDLDDGILTNNRRLVTKTMWCNGTALSAQARRALENERVTVVAHSTGYIHTLFPTATIAPEAYTRFSERLRSFLSTDLNVETLGNFLRHSRKFQPCFQLRTQMNGRDHYIPLDRAFEYEQDSPARLTDHTRSRLLAEMDLEEFHHLPLPNRIVLNDLEDFVRDRHFDFSNPSDLEDLRQRFSSDCLKAAVAIENLIKFCHVSPRLPDLAAKQRPAPLPPLELHPDMQREELLERLQALRAVHPTVELAFHAYRDLNAVDDRPFLLAAMERNPVALAATTDMTDAALAERIYAMPDESIYDERGRLAQPDEVWNFARGDGVEKAILLANCLRARHPGTPLTLQTDSDDAELRCGGQTWRFPTSKGLTPRQWDLTDGKREGEK